MTLILRKLHVSSLLTFPRGEQTASALEKQLDGIESRIEALLAAAEQSSANSRVQDDHGQNSTTLEKP